MGDDLNGGKNADRFRDTLGNVAAVGWTLDRRELAAVQLAKHDKPFALSIFHGEGSCSANIRVMIQRAHLNVRSVMLCTIKHKNVLDPVYDKQFTINKGSDVASAEKALAAFDKCIGEWRDAPHFSIPQSR